MTVQEQMIELLQAEVARLNALASGHRDDFERERGRIDQLLSELLTATGDLMRAKEIIGRLGGQVALLKSHDLAIANVPVMPPAPIRRPWWRRLAG
jgi:hypothetical protein